MSCAATWRICWITGSLLPHPVLVKLPCCVWVGTTVVCVHARTAVNLNKLTRRDVHPLPTGGRVAGGPGECMFLHTRWATAKRVPERSLISTLIRNTRVHP